MQSDWAENDGFHPKHNILDLRETKTGEIEAIKKTDTGRLIASPARYV
jgi:hypothetical protein